MRSSRGASPPLLALVAVAGLAIAAGAGALAVGLGQAGSAAGVTPAPGMPTRAGAAPRFVDEAAAAGVAFTYGGGFEYSVGAGVATFDCDTDGDHDLYFAGGENPAALYRNDSEVGGPLRFTRLASPATDLTAVNGAYPLRLRSNDESVDLMVLRLGRNVLLEGSADCAFRDTNESLALDGGGENSQAFSATWESGQSLPTLAFGNYLEPGNLDPETRCQPNALLRPSTAGNGHGAYDPPVPLDPSFCALSMLFSDWSGAGRRDLRVSNDRAFYRQDAGSEQLWRFDPGAAPRLYTEADGWATVRVEGMGIGSFDLTGDGLPEIYLTSQAANKLQSLAAGPERPAYVDIGLPRNVNVPHPFMGDDMDLPSTAWHPEFADVNNDGLIDLFVSKGNTTEAPDYAMQDPSNLLLGQPDGTFREAADTAGIVTYDRARGAALVDLNRDGRLDLVESFYGAPVRIWRNAGPVEGEDAGRAHWVALRLRQEGANVDAIGAVVEIRSGAWRQTRELVVGGGHAGGQLGWLHVGLGEADRPEVRVRWPDGVLGDWQTVPTDDFSVIDRAAGD